MGDEAPAAVKQEAGPPPVGCVAPRRPDALLVHALRLQDAGGEELDVVRREGVIALLFSQNPCDKIPFGTTKSKIVIDFTLLQDPRSSERLHLRCRDLTALVNSKESGLIW